MIQGFRVIQEQLVEVAVCKHSRGANAGRKSRRNKAELNCDSSDKKLEAVLK
jgi:hypothetical protein